MNAEIITIGDEILIGQIVDTNSAWMGEALNKIGVSVSQISSISDKASAIIGALELSLERADLILLTGGLGPTNDDITKKTLADYFCCKMVLHEGALAKIQAFVDARGAELNTNNKNQAVLPSCAKIILNNNGTASGMWFEKNGKVVVAMPGVPFEMMQMMEEAILPMISAYFETPQIYHKTVLTTGIPEAKLSEILTDWERELPESIKLAYLPSPGLNKLRLSAYGDDMQLMQSDIYREILKLRDILGHTIWGYNDDTLEALVGKELIDLHGTIATAESCTGGAIAEKITSIAGSSKYYKGSVVAYGDDVKIKQLKVSEEALQQYGAVSKEVVEQMAVGVKLLFETDYAIATSGIAGPDGGTIEKPVGTVWIAIAGPNFIHSAKYQFGTRRDHNITRSAIMGLFMMFDKLRVH